MAITTLVSGLTRPAHSSTSTTGVTHRTAGILFGVLGIGLVAASLVLSVATGALVLQGGAEESVRSLAALSFGLAVAGLGTGKTGIALLLWGIVRRIWLRVAAVRDALPSLVTATPKRSAISHGVIGTRHGSATVTLAAPEPLLIHRMARVMWAPMLAMGVIAVYLGLALAYLESQSARDTTLFRSLDAWVKGLQFLGEGFLLSAVSFFLGSILGAIRSGGGEVQEHLGVQVHTLRMPLTGKIFIGLMMAGLVIEVAQFVLYAYVSTINDPAIVSTLVTWLGPFREFGLGVLLSGIVLALATIAKALDFQFTRVVDLIQNGR